MRLRTAIFFVMVFVLMAATCDTAPADAVSETDKIKTLVDNECIHLRKDRMKDLLVTRFSADVEKGIAPELLNIMAGVIKRTDFDNIAEEKTVEIIGLVHESYKRGAPLEYLDQIFDVAYEKTISPENLSAAAKALQEFHHSDVPGDIAEEFVYHSLEDAWDPAAVPVLTRGLIYGVERGLTPKRIALIILLDVQQGALKKKSAGQLVLDAIELVRDKEPKNWKPLRQPEKQIVEKQAQKRKLADLQKQAEEEKKQREIAREKADEEVQRLRSNERNKALLPEQEQLVRQLDQKLKASKVAIAKYEMQQRQLDEGLARHRAEVEREKQKRDREREIERQRQLSQATESIAVSGRSGRFDVLKLYAAVDRYIGIPYRYGGDSELGIDCSAFTRRVYRENNVELPRTSREQSFVGLGVGFEIMQPGDLVFFDTSITGTVSHVGVYLGGGTFAHASSSAGVKKSNLHEKYYVKRFLKANRVFTM